MARILIVDDDPDVVDAVRIVLEREGHDVCSASNRDEGMDAVRAGGHDLVILDIMMTEPDDGLAMAQDLRAAGFSRPILMMSSISKVTGMEYGADDAVAPVDDFLEKPVAPKTLCAKVDALLAKGGK